MSTETRKYTVLIVGAGIAGPTLALTILKNANLSNIYTPVLIDRLPSSSNISSESEQNHSYTVGTAVVISANALYPLHKLGLKEEFEAISQEVKTMEMWRCYGSGQEKGKFFNRLNSPGWAQDLESGLRMVERGKLQELLINKVSELGGEVIWGKKVLDVADVEGSGIELHFDDGEVKRGDLVVGADGGWSAVRKRVIVGFGDREEKSEELEGTKAPVDEWMPDFQNSSIAYGISSLPQNVIDDPEFEDKILGRGHVVMLDTSICSTWPLPNGAQIWSIQRTEEHPPSSVSETLKSAKFPNATINTGGYPLESTEKFMESFANVWHPLAGTFGALFEKSERIVRGGLWQKVWEEEAISNGKNTVVIGDAGRVMLPGSGQGACMAIEDATVLANLLLRNPPTFSSFNFNCPANFSTALQEYAAVRISRSKAIAKQAYWSGLISMGERWWWRWVRDLSTAWLKMDTDLKEVAKSKGETPKDMNYWLYGARFEVGAKEEEDEN